jgi:hypothetical protein
VFIYSLARWTIKRSFKNIRNQSRRWKTCCIVLKYMWNENNYCHSLQFGFSHHMTKEKQLKAKMRLTDCNIYVLFYQILYHKHKQQRFKRPKRISFFHKLDENAFGHQNSDKHKSKKFFSLLWTISNDLNNILLFLHLNWEKFFCLF